MKPPHWHNLLSLFCGPLLGTAAFPVASNGQDTENLLTQTVGEIPSCISQP